MSEQNASDSMPQPPQLRAYVWSGLWLQWTLANATGMVLATTVFWLGGWLVIGTMYFCGGFMVLGAATGLLNGSLVGVMQWLVLRRRNAQVGRWVLATAVGWTVGESLGSVMSQSLDIWYWGYLGSQVINGAIVGVVVGICASAMQWFMLRQRDELNMRWLLANIAGWAVGLALISIRDVRSSGINLPMILAQAAIAGGLAGALTGIALPEWMPTPTPRIKWPAVLFRPLTALAFWLKWTLACALGGGLAAILARAANAGVFSPLARAWGYTASQALLGAMAGALVGALQWRLVLHQRAARGGRWEPVAASGWVVGWIIGGALSWSAVSVVYLDAAWVGTSQLTRILVGAGIGAVGVCAASLARLLLRPRSREYWPGWWLLTSAIAWSLAWAWSSSAAGLLMGSVAGIVTGLPLALTLPEPLPTDSVSTPNGWRTQLQFGLVICLLITCSIGAPALLARGLQPCNWLDRALQHSGCLHTLHGSTEGVVDVAFAPDGATVAGVTFDGTVQTWRVSDGAWQHAQPAPQDYAQQDGSGRHILAPGLDMLVSSRKGQVFLWRASDGVLLHTLQDPRGGMGDLALSPDGDLLAWCANTEQETLVWRVSDGMLLRVFKGNVDNKLSLAFAPDGETLAVGTRNGHVQLWRLADGTLSRLFLAKDWPVNELVFAADGSILAALSPNKIWLWRVDDGALLHTLSHKDVNSIALSPDGVMLASGAQNGTIRLWRVADGKHVRTFHHSRKSSWSTDPVSDLAFSPDGATLAWGVRRGGVDLWDVRNAMASYNPPLHTQATASLQATPSPPLPTPHSNQAAESVQVVQSWNLHMDYPLTADNVTLALLEQRILDAGLDAPRDQARDFLRLFLAVRAERLKSYPAVRIVDLPFYYFSSREPLDERLDWRTGTRDYVQRRLTALEQVSAGVSLPSSYGKPVNANAGIVYSLFSWDYFFATGDAVGLLMDRAGIDWRSAIAEEEYPYGILAMALRGFSKAEQARLLAEAQSSFDYPALLDQAQHTLESLEAPPPLDSRTFADIFPFPYDFEWVSALQGAEGAGISTGLTGPQLFDFYAAWLEEDGWQQVPAEETATRPHQVWRKDKAKLRFELHGFDDQGRSIISIEMQLPGPGD